MLYCAFYRMAIAWVQKLAIRLMLTLDEHWVNNAVSGNGYESMRGWVSLKVVILQSANHFKKLYDLLLQIEDFFSRPPLPLPLPALSSDPSTNANILASLSGEALLVVPRTPQVNAITDRIALADLAMSLLTTVEESAGEVSLKRTGDRIRHFKRYLKETGNNLKLNDSRIGHELRTLREALDDDLNEHRVFSPSLAKLAFISGMGAQYNFSLIHQNLPDAHYELIQAQFCYVADNDAACVYHSLNASEYALRALATKLRVTKRQRDSWGTMISSLRHKLEGKPGSKGLQKQKRSTKRNAQIDYYSQLLDQCVFFNEHWRKKVAHMPPRYTAAEALNALTRAAEFVRLLAERGLNYRANYQNRLDERAVPRNDGARKT